MSRASDNAVAAQTIRNLRSDLAAEVQRREEERLGWVKVTTIERQGREEAERRLEALQAAVEDSVDRLTLHLTVGPVVKLRAALAASREEKP